MNRKREEWIDRDIRGEISNAEEIYVGLELERNPALYAEFQKEEEWARRICRGFQASQAKLPSDFYSARLEKALAESPAWENFKEKNVRIGSRFGRMRTTGKRWGFVACASAATIAIAVGATFAVWTFERGRSNELAADFVAKSDDLKGADESGVKPVLASDDETAKPYVFRIPAPEGNPPDAVPSRWADDLFWARFRVEEARRKSFVGEFQRFCAKCDVGFDKIGDSEFLLKKVSPENWRTIAEWSETKGKEGNENGIDGGKNDEDGSASRAKTFFETSKAVERWRCAADGRARDVRVSFSSDRFDSVETNGAPQN